MAEGEGEKGRWERGREREEDPETSNHNLALCRVVSLRSEEALRNEFVRFGGLSWARARVEAAYKERAEHIFTVKIHGRESLRGARRYRVGFTVYSFNLFNRPVDVDANGGSEKNAGNSIRSREERELGNESNVNEFSSGYVFF